MTTTAIVPFAPFTLSVHPRSHSNLRACHGRRYHPDKQKDEADAAVAAERFKWVQRAYTVLSDRGRRQAYNDLITAAWRVEVGDDDDDVG